MKDIILFKNKKTMKINYYTQDRFIFTDPKDKTKTKQQCKNEWDSKYFENYTTQPMFTLDYIDSVNVVLNLKVNDVIKASKEKYFKLSIKNKIKYYFVLDYKINDNSIEYKLKLDVITTYLDSLNFEEPTYVKRTHLDRYIEDEKYEITYNYTKLTTPEGVGEVNYMRKEIRAQEVRDKEGVATDDYWLKLGFDTIFRQADDNYYIAIISEEGDKLAEKFEAKRVSAGASPDIYNYVLLTNDRFDEDGKWPFHDGSSDHLISKPEEFIIKGYNKYTDLPISIAPLISDKEYPGHTLKIVKDSGADTSEFKKYSYYNKEFHKLSDKIINIIKTPIRPYGSFLFKNLKYDKTNKTLSYTNWSVDKGFLLNNDAFSMEIKKPETGILKTLEGLTLTNKDPIDIMFQPKFLSKEFLKLEIKTSAGDTFPIDTLFTKDENFNISIDIAGDGVLTLLKLPKYVNDDYRLYSVITNNIYSYKNVSTIPFIDSKYKQFVREQLHTFNVKRGFNISRVGKDTLGVAAQSTAAANSSFWNTFNPFSENTTSDDMKNTLKAADNLFNSTEGLAMHEAQRTQIGMIPADVNGANEDVTSMINHKFGRGGLNIRETTHVDIVRDNYKWIFHKMGYNANTFININSYDELLKRIFFTYWEIPSIYETINTDSLDVIEIKELNNQFSKGVRLWKYNVETFTYKYENWEKGLNVQYT